MPTRKFGPDDFRWMIIQDLPELAATLEAHPVSSHRDASDLRMFTLHALHTGDVALTVRVFRLARRLVDLAGEFDFYSENALWTEFLSGFGAHFPQGLEVFRRMPLEVRQSVYSPFVFPHTWFDRETLDAACPQGQPYIPTIEAQERVRYFRQSGGPGQYADVTLKISPDVAAGHPVFVNGVPADQSLPLKIVEVVRDTARERIAHMCREGRRLCGATITLASCGYHAVDTRSADVERVAGKAFDNALNRACLTRLDSR